MPDSSRIYITDMDGTLLRDDATLSGFARCNLESLIDRGVDFTVASARSVVAIRQVLGNLPLRLPVIAINGAFVTEYDTGRHIIINQLDPDMVQDIYGRILKHQLVPFVSSFDGERDRLYFSKLINGGMRWYHDNRLLTGDERLTYIHDLERTIGRDNIVALSVMGTHDKLKPLAEELECELGQYLENHFFENPYSLPWWWLTIHDRKACKSQAVKALVDYAGKAMEDLVVFGDNLNDVKMFKLAHCSIAVGNATDEVKSHASEVIGTNEMDSVVKYIMGDVRS